MPRKKIEEGLKETKIRFFEGDFEKLQALFPQTGAGPAVRKIIRSFIHRVERANAPLEIDLPTSDLKEIFND